MKTQNFIPTALLAALVALPSIVFAANHQPAVNQDNITPASATAMPALNTLQQEIQDPKNGLLATQSGNTDLQDSADIDDDSTDTDSDEMDDAEVDNAGMNSADETDVNEIDSDSEDDEQVAAPAANIAPAQLNQQHSTSDYSPLIQGEVNRGNETPADLQNQSAPITLQEKKKGPRGELLATQPGEVQLLENRRFDVR